MREQKSLRALLVEMDLNLVIFGHLVVIDANYRSFSKHPVRHSVAVFPCRRGDVADRSAYCCTRSAWRRGNTRCARVIRCVPLPLVSPLSPCVIAPQWALARNPLGVVPLHIQIAPVDVFQKPARRVEHHLAVPKTLTGVTEKTLDLELLLTQISPHVDCSSLKSVIDLVVKGYAAEHEDRTALARLFDEFDVIFDCTTDNQLMRVMDATSTKAQVVNLSITNHAQDLICAFSPNVTETVLFVYGLLKRDAENDMYNPTGCWNPTFKASYNDIESKVQFAIKHIISMLSSEKSLSNFFITEDDADLKIHRL